MSKKKQTATKKAANDRVKISQFLPPAVKVAAEKRAVKLGMSLTGYIETLVIKAVRTKAA